MTKSSFDNDLAQAAIDVIDERAYNHPAVHAAPFARLVSELLPPIAAEHHGQIPKDVLDDVCRSAAEYAKLGDKGSSGELKKLLQNYRLVIVEQDTCRILNRADVPAPWLGFDSVAAPHLHQVERFRRIAHLHMLAYPELLEAVELLAPPGRTEGAVESALRDRFAFTRKINGVIANYLLAVMQTFDMTSESNNVLRNAWAPPSVLAALVVRRYLELTEFSIDRGVDTADLLRQCAAIVPGRFFQRHPVDMEWYQALRAPPDVCTSEVGGAQLRIRADGILWFARAGLLSPVHCAILLRKRRAKDALARVRTRILDRVRSFNPLPINVSEIEAELGARDNA
jgi:hypothetical protein